MTTKSSSKNMKQGPKDVDPYLASRPEALGRSLQTLREAIQAAVPDAE